MLTTHTLAHGGAQRQRAAGEPQGPSQRHEPLPALPLPLPPKSPRRTSAPWGGETQHLESMGRLSWALHRLGVLALGGGIPYGMQGKSIPGLFESYMYFGVFRRRTKAGGGKKKERERDQSDMGKDKHGEIER